MAKPYQESEYNLLTLGRLVELHEGFVQAGGNKKNQAKFQNCVHPNLLAGGPATKVLSILFPPELHLLIGVVDKHLQGLEKVFGLCWVDAFLKNVHGKSVICVLEEASSIGAGYHERVRSVKSRRASSATVPQRVP